MNFQQIVFLFVICGLSVAQSDFNDEDYANVVCNFQLGGTQFCDCGFSKNVNRLFCQFFSMIHSIYIHFS